MLIRSILQSRWLVTGVLVGLVAGSVGVGSYVATSASGRIGYCAQMRDGVGLYPGNLVTRLGVPIGTVRSVEPESDHVVVRFDVDGDEALRTNTGAVATADSLIAVRELSLVVGADPGPERSPGSCIPLSETKTPLSLTESLESVADLAAQLTMKGGPGSAEAAKRLVKVANAELAGTGPVINNILRQVANGSTADMLPALGDLTETIDNLSDLAVGMDGNLPVLTELLTTIAPMIGGTFVPSLLRIQRIMYNAVPIVQALVGLLDRYGQHLWPVMDAVVPTVRLVAAGIRNVKDFLALLPPLLDSFHTVVAGGQVRVRYSPPKWRMPVTDPVGACRALNKLGGGTCSVAGGSHVDADILRQVLAMTGGAK